MLLEKDLWEAAAYKSTTGDRIALTAQEQIAAGAMTPATETERRFALMPARVDRVGAKNEHDLWYDGKLNGKKDRLIRDTIETYKNTGNLIPSTLEEVATAKQSGEDIFVFGAVAPSQVFETQLDPMKKRVPYLQTEYIERGGLPPQDNQIGGSHNNYAWRQHSGAAMTAAEAWYRGTSNNIPKAEIVQAIKAGIASGVMHESPADHILKAINQATIDAGKTPYAWGPVDAIQMSRANREVALKARTQPMEQNAPYTATGTAGESAIPDVISTQSGRKVVVRPGAGTASTQGMRRRANDQVAESKTRIYNEIDYGKTYTRWNRNITPEVEVVRETRNPAAGIRGSKGGGMLAISRIGVPEKYKKQSQNLASAGTAPEPQKKMSTAKKVGITVAVIVTTLAAGYGVKKLVEK